MDINGCKPLFDHQVVAHTSIGKEFVGTLQSIAGSTLAVTLVPLPAGVAAQYQFAINGVNAIDVSIIVFMQELRQPH